MRPLLLVLGLMMTLGYYCSTSKDFFDSGFDSGQDIPLDSEPLVPGLCGFYSGFWTADGVYSFSSTEAGATQTGRTGTVSRSLADWSESGDTVLFTVIDAGEWTVEGQENTQTTVRSSLRCDPDGVWLLGKRSEYSYTSGGTDYSGWVEEIPAEPMLILRANLAVGSRWTSSTQVAITTSAGGASEEERAYGYEVTAEETVDVPAGSFTTLKLVNTVDQSAQWLELEAGLVLSDELQLDQWSR